MPKQAHSSDVFLTARREGWAEEVQRLTVYGDRLTTYRKDGKEIRVRTGHEGRIMWCSRQADDRKYDIHLSSQFPRKADHVIEWMTEPW